MTRFSTGGAKRKDSTEWSPPGVRALPLLPLVLARRVTVESENEPSADREPFGMLFMASVNGRR